MRRPGIEPGAHRILLCWQRWILPLNHQRWLFGQGDHKLILYTERLVIFHVQAPRFSHTVSSDVLSHNSTCIPKSNQTGTYLVKQQQDEAR